MFNNGVSAGDFLRILLVELAVVEDIPTQLCTETAQGIVVFFTEVVRFVLMAELVNDKGVHVGCRSVIKPATAQHKNVVIERATAQAEYMTTPITS